MKTILVVDDEFGLTDVLVTALEDSGYRAHGAYDGAQGLALARTEAPSLVLVDFMMPAVDGPAFIRAMREDPALARVPVVMMSAVPESTVRRRTSDYAAFLRKPFDFDAVLQVLAKLT